MKRHAIAPRPGWQRIVESQGLEYHTVDGFAYWDESAYYTFDRRDANRLEAASLEVWRLCTLALDAVVASGELGILGVPDAHAAWVAESWRRRDPWLYARFDFAYDGNDEPRLLEFNADTPTSLVESSVAQWYWLQDRFPGADQYNSVHERLVGAWRGMGLRGVHPVHFSCIYGCDEDWMTITYLRDTAEQAGLPTVPIAVEDIGWNAARGTFVDEEERPIHTLFKLYPWEWLLREPFGAMLARAPVRWIEPAWKTMLSSKAILPVLWEMFPDCPYLLPASFEPMAGDHVRKPVHSREGNNIRMVRNAAVIEETAGPYADGASVYQALAELRSFDGRFPTVGSWLVGGHACGLGVREDASRITRNTSSFVPHVYSA
jgi:glutathionylspermidine synthase